jgi:hypothetical protein
MYKQNKKDRRQALTIEIEALEKRLLDCYFIVERDHILVKIKQLNQELKSCLR